MYDYRLVAAKLSLDHPWMRRPTATHPRRAEDAFPAGRNAQPQTKGRR
jgi:hypothetical protein